MCLLLQCDPLWIPMTTTKHADDGVWQRWRQIQSWIHQRIRQFSKVHPRLTPARSKRMAARGGGSFGSAASYVDQHLDQLMADIHARLKQSGGDEGFLSDVPFASLAVDTVLRRAMAEEFKYANLSDAQARFLPQLLASPRQDAFVKASTGSGKTLGFLLPSIQTALFSSDQPGRVATAATAAGHQGVATDAGVRVLVLSPTRELASQTANESRRLLTFAP